MTALRAPFASVAVALLAVACSGPEPGESRGDETTAALLSGPVTDGTSTVLPRSRGGGEAPSIPLAELGYNLGQEEALVKVVELSDFGCGYCRKFHDETFPTLRSEFIETGMVEWKFMPYVTGMFANSPAATEASECVMEQSSEAYEAITHRLWAEQPAWKGASDPEPVIRDWIDGLGVDMAELETCLADNRRTPRIDAATGLARQFGVRGTPTFIVIGYPPIQGALELAFFQEILTAVHADVSERAAAEDQGSGN